MSTSLLGTSPHQTWEVMGVLLGSQGPCSCFANTQEAPPEGFPHKVSAGPSGTGQEGEKPNGVLCFVFCVEFQCSPGCAGEGGAQTLQSGTPWL